MFGQTMKKQRGKGNGPGQGAGRGMGRRGRMRGNFGTAEERGGCGRNNRRGNPHVHGHWTTHEPEHAADAPRPEPAPENARRAFDPMADSGTCPFCDKHCSLSDPGCPKGQAYARRM